LQVVGVLGLSLVISAHCGVWKELSALVLLAVALFFSAISFLAHVVVPNQSSNLKILVSHEHAQP
jgi:hypothetical protein